jgi:hypothetical protein
MYKQIWLIIMASMVLAVWVMRALYIMEEKMEGPPPNESQNVPAPEWSMTQYFVQVVGHMTGSGEPIPCHDGMKTFLVFWLLYATVISGISLFLRWGCNVCAIDRFVTLYILVMVAAIYRGLLTSHLNFPDMTPTIDRLDDLVQATSRRTMSWGLMGGTSQHSLWRNENHRSEA